MSPTEHDLHTFYNALPTDENAQQRLLVWIEDQPPHTPARPERTRSGARRRLVAASGLVCALAAATTLLSNHAHGPRQPSADGGTTVSPSAPDRSGAASTPASSHPASTAKPTQRLTQVSPQVAVHTLIALLPRPVTTTGLAGRHRPTFAAGEVVVDDGHGAAQMSIVLHWPDPGRPGTDTTGCGRPTPTCTTLAHGTQVSSYKQYEYPPGRPRGAMEWSVTAYRKDGLQVTVSEFNAPAEKGAKSTRRNPPFSIAQLTAIATYPAWQRRVPAAQVKRYAKLFTPDPLPTPQRTR